jgi:hypothetical protein
VRHGAVLCQRRGVHALNFLLAGLQCAQRNDDVVVVGQCRPVMLALAGLPFRLMLATL